MMEFSKNFTGWRSGINRIWLALTILILCLLLTLVSCLIVKSKVESDAKKEFDFACDEIQNKISVRLHAHAQLLRSASAFLKASSEVTRDEWKSFYSDQLIENNLPGIQGVGYSIIILPNKLAQHVEKIRNKGYPQYDVRPQGIRELYTSIIYLEPFSGRNLSAFGYDMFSEPIRRNAMEIARDNNVASLSGRITLVQENDKDIQSGTLMYVPVYKKGMPVETVEQRRRAIEGWVYSPYRMNDLMKEILGGYEAGEIKHIHLGIFDSSSFNQNALLYDSREVMKTNAPNSSLFSSRTYIVFNDHKWYLQFEQYDSISPVLDYGKVWYTAVGGFGISLLLFLLYLSLVNTNARAYKLAEELTRDLSDSESKYKTIFNNEVYAICIFDLETFELLDVNDRYCQLYGYNKDELLSGMNISDITAEIEASESSAKQAINEGTIFIPLRLHKKKDGTVFPVEIVGGPYTWKGKNVMFALANDITKRKQNEIKLEKALVETSHFRDALDNVSSYVYMKDTQSRYIYANRLTLELFGCSAEELIGCNDTRFFHPDTVKMLRDIDSKVLSGEKTTEEIDITFANGERKVYLEIKSPIYENPDSKIIWGLMGISTDITDRKITEQELELYRNHLEELVKSRTAELDSTNELLRQEIEKDKEFEMMLKKSLEKEKELNEMKSRFITTTSHEFRTPLTTLLLSSDLIKRYGEKWNEEKKNEHFDKIRNSVKYITKLLDDILTLNRTENGEISYNPEMLDLHNFTLECVSDAKALITKNQELNYIFNSEEKEFYLDIKLMKFILSNLLSNAIKFSPEGGKIELIISADSCYLNIETADEGIGIPAGDIEKIFDSFYRSKNAEDIAGTGLGLAIVKRSVELHHGIIRVNSVLNKGTTFLVVIPIVVA